MALNEEQSLEVLNQLIQDAADPEFTRTIKALVHRQDYQDYIVVLSNMRYCEIREKLVTDYQQLKNEDVKREVMYKFKHAIELEEWQLEDMGLSGEISEEDLASASNQDGTGGFDREDGEDFKKKSAIDDSDKYDWL